MDYKGKEALGRCVFLVPALVFKNMLEFHTVCLTESVCSVLPQVEQPSVPSCSVYPGALATAGDQNPCSASRWSERVDSPDFQGMVVGGWIQEFAVGDHKWW